MERLVGDAAMYGGLKFSPEQIRALPLSMQLQIGMGIAVQMAQATMAAGRTEETVEEEDDEM